MQNKSRDWLIVIGLALLALVPLVGGAVRIFKVGRAIIQSKI